MALPSPFVWSWTQMIQYNNEYLTAPNERVHYIRSVNSYHSFARNNLVKQMKGDWLLMLDTDHAFDPDIVARLLKIMQDIPTVKVLTAIYQYVTPPYSPKLYRFTQRGRNLTPLGKWEKFDERYLVPIDAAGAGCLLVRKEVFQEIECVFKCQPFDIHPPFSEDNSFFWRLKKLNIPAFCDPSIEYRHLTFKEVTMKDYESEKLDFKKHRIHNKET